MTSSTPGTGIEHWWTYEERAIPGIGKAMVNVGTGNLVVSAMDVDIPETGIDLAFQRVYNTQSLHDYNGDDGGDRAIFGNLWTNDLDTNIVYNSTANTITVYDIDGTACVYTANGRGNWVPCTGEHAQLVPTDSTDCTYAWTKKNGTIYWFHTDSSGGGCGIPLAKKGHLQEILARNNNNNITFTYSYDGSGKGPEDITEIDANHSDGQELRMVFGIIPGTSINELSTITRPDQGVLQYSYDTSGNLLRVDKPGNNTATPTAPSGSPSVPAGDLPETYAYATGTSSLEEACGPVCTIANWNHPGSPDRGSALLFTLDGSSRLTQWQVDGVLNFTPGDGTNTPLHSSLSQAFQVWFTANFVYGASSSPCGTTIAGTTTMCDTDNHSSIWTTDSSSRVSQTQDWTGTNETTYLVTAEGWDPNNNLTSTTDARGYTTNYSYDGNANTTNVALPSPTTGAAGQGPTSMYSYDSFNNVLSYCDPVYNANHNNSTCPTGQTSGPTASFNYNFTYGSEPYGVLTKIYSALGYERDISYDPNSQGAGGTQVGLPTSETGNGGSAITQADGTTRTPTQSFTYDSHGNLQTFSRGENTWTMSYDSLNRETIRSDGDTYTGFPAAGISSYTCYYLDGSVAYTESASQHSADGSGNSCPTPVTAPTYATASTYDADGDQTGLVDHKGGGTGTTTKYYDGLDRLIEVVMPYDGRYSNEYFGFSWMTRYQYDLTQSVGTVNIAAKNAVAYGLAYGGLYKTQEYLPSYLIQPGGGISSGNWTDVRGNFFDGMDRSVAKYETAFSDSAAAEVLNTYDTNGYLGLLTKMTNGASQFIKYAYDDTNRKSQLTLNNSYTPGGGVSPPANDTRTYVYDPDSRPTSISNNMGSVTYSYDADGRTTNINEPSSEDGASTICYAYYADGMREYVSTGTTCPSGTSGQHGISQANIFSYSYRKDGLLQNQAVNWSASGNPAFSWTYTPGGRELTQSDPLTGTAVPELTNGVQLGGATWTYERKSYTYDATGRPSTLTLPEGYTEGSGANPITYDRDDEVTGFNQYNNGFCTASCQLFQANGITRQFLLNTRGEMLEDSIPAIPNSGTFQQSANGYLEYGVEWDTRSNMMYSEPYWFPVQGQGPQYGSQNFIYDAAGRQATGWYSYNQLLPPPVQTPPNGALYVYNRTYDAENHVVNAPAPSSIDANANNNCGYQCAPDATFTWGPDGHLRTISGSGFQTGLHYDGDTILFGSNAQGPVLHLGTMGTLTLAGTFSIMDRDSSGTQQAVHGATWFGPWNLGPAIPRFGKGTVSVTLAPGSCAPDQNGQNANCPNYSSSGGGYVAQARTDGYTYGTYTFQGVRIFDSNSSQWLSPDAYAGDAHDPMSQKPFMWNNNNPFEYSDPTGYDVGPVAAGGAGVATVACAILEPCGIAEAIGAIGAIATEIILTVVESRRPSTPPTGPPNTASRSGHSVTYYGPQGTRVKKVDLPPGKAHGGIETPHTDEYGRPNITPSGVREGNRTTTRPSTPDEIEDAKNRPQGSSPIEPSDSSHPQTPP